MDVVAAWKWSVLKMLGGMDDLDSLLESDVTKYMIRYASGYAKAVPDDIFVEDLKDCIEIEKAKRNGEQLTGQARLAEWLHQFLGSWDLVVETDKRFDLACVVNGKAYVTNKIVCAIAPVEISDGFYAWHDLAETFYRVGDCDWSVYPNPEKSDFLKRDYYSDFSCGVHDVVRYQSGVSAYGLWDFESDASLIDANVFNAVTSLKTTSGSCMFYLAKESTNDTPILFWWKRIGVMAVAMPLYGNREFEVGQSG